MVWVVDARQRPRRRPLRASTDGAAGRPGVPPRSLADPTLQIALENAALELGYALVVRPMP